MYFFTYLLTYLTEPRSTEPMGSHNIHDYSVTMHGERFIRAFRVRILCWRPSRHVVTAYRPYTTTSLQPLEPASVAGSWKFNRQRL